VALFFSSSAGGWLTPKLKKRELKMMPNPGYTARFKENGVKLYQDVGTGFFACEPGLIEQPLRG